MKKFLLILIALLAYANAHRASSQTVSAVPGNMVQEVVALNAQVASRASGIMSKHGCPVCVSHPVATEDGVHALISYTADGVTYRSVCSHFASYEIPAAQRRAQSKAALDALLREYARDKEDRYASK